MPQTPAPIRYKPERDRKKQKNFSRKPQKAHRKPIHPARMYKKIIMQKNMQKINLCRPGMQLLVDMP